MFKELAPYLRQRAVLLTITHLEDDQISVSIIPKKLKDGENTALTTPIKLTGTAEELDEDLPSSIVGFVAAHLQLKNTLERAKAEMDAAGKAAQAEARAKKQPAKKETSNGESAKTDAATKPAVVPKPEPAKTFGLFDAPVTEAQVAQDVDEEEEILAEANTNREEEEEDEDLDQAA